MRITSSVSWAALLASSLSACASVGGMRSAPLDEGVVRYFDADLRPAVLAVRNACLGSQLEIEEVNRINDDSWMIIAKRSSGEWTWGELVRIVVERTPTAQNDARVVVRILTKRRAALNVTAKGDWSEELFTQIALELVEGG